MVLRDVKVGRGCFGKGLGVWVLGWARMRVYVIFAVFRVREVVILCC